MLFQVYSTMQWFQNSDRILFWNIVFDDPIMWILSQGNLISIWNLNADSNVESKLEEAGLRGREILNRFRFPIFPDWEQERGERGLVLKMLGINYTEVWFLERSSTRSSYSSLFLALKIPRKEPRKESRSTESEK
jgi:hypothetical protein